MMDVLGMQQVSQVLWTGRFAGEIVSDYERSNLTGLEWIWSNRVLVLFALDSPFENSYRRETIKAKI